MARPRGLDAILLLATFLLLFISFSVYVSIRLGDVNKLKVQMRWIERKFDQGKILVIDKETLEEMKKQGFEVEPMIVAIPSEGG